MYASSPANPTPAAPPPVRGIGVRPGRWVACVVLLGVLFTSALAVLAAGAWVGGVQHGAPTMLDAPAAPSVRPAAGAPG